jgi:hypothetical protein
MAVDFAEKERDFLDSLAEDTGRDLAGWMAAIAATGLDDRNAIIDWLRTQGFLFAKASWLERIHHNGGRPIYADPAHIRGGPGAGSERAATERARPRPPEIAEPPPREAPPDRRADAPAVANADTPAALKPGPPAPASPDPASLETLLAEAKAYRPLAQFVLREIEKAIADVRLEARPGWVSLVRGREFGILTIAPKELRLALAFGDRTAPGPFVKARFPRPLTDTPPALTHMVVLTDARQITPELLAAVRAVAAAGA